MKILVFILLYICFVSLISCNSPVFFSFPTSPISNHNQKSLLFVLKCTSPLYLYLNNNFTPLSNISNQQFNEWYNINKPVSVAYGNGRKSTSIPDLLSFNQFDISLSISTPLEEQEFIIQVSDNCFFDKDSSTVPYSSPLIVTRGSNSYKLRDLVYNPLSIYKYTQKSIKSWDEKLIDVDYRDSVVSNINGTTYLDIKLAIQGSGSGEAKLQPKINADGYDYQIDEFTISISKKDPVYQIPLKFMGTINLFQEKASAASILPSSRDEFFSDVLKIKASKYICNEEPTLFQNLVYLDVVALENNNKYLSYLLRPIENVDVLALEYIWEQEIGWKKVSYLEDDGYGCKFLDRRNQFCQFCDRVYHRFQNTNISYSIYNTDGKGSLIDFGLSIDVNKNGKSSLYFKNEEDSYLGNSQSLLKFSFDSFLNIGSSYVLIPESIVQDSSYYVWLLDINSGCTGININGSNFFYEGSCNLDQYSCSNIHYFREPQNLTQFINQNYNYLYSNKRSGIRYDNGKLSIEIPQTQMEVSLSLYVPSLPFQQPLIKELLFKYKESVSFIFIYYSFINYGNKDGDFSIQIACTDSNAFISSGTIKPNSTQDLEFSFPKSIVKRITNYECISRVLVDSQKFWSIEDKEIESSIQFTIIPNDITQQCNQDYSNLLKVSKQSFRKEDITLLFTIHNQIDSIDMFRLNVSCSGNTAQSKIIQIQSGSSINVPISIQESSNSKCKSTIESYQIDCKYNLYSNEWDYINNSSLLKPSYLSLLFILMLLF